MLLLVDTTIGKEMIIHLARARGEISLVPERVYHLVVLDMEQVAVREPAGHGPVVVEVVLILMPTMVYR